MRQPTDNRRYSDEPLCVVCHHPKVVHRSIRHDGDCAGLGCRCRKFAGSAVEATA